MARGPALAQVRVAKGRFCVEIADPEKLVVGIRWERLAGDTSRFALRISFADDPDPEAGATPEESLSWGGLQIWVRDTNLCAHRYEGEIIDSVHWYLLPFLEWCVGSWDALLHEERLPNRNADATAQGSLSRTSEPPRSFSNAQAEAWEQNWYDWWGRHCIEAGRSGGIFPSICFRRWRDKIELSWADDAQPGRPPGLQFVQATGAVRLESREVAEPMYRLLTEATDFLAAQSESPRIVALQRAVISLRSAYEDRFAWLLGLGSTLEQMRESWKQLRQRLSKQDPKAFARLFMRDARGEVVLYPPPAALMFGAVSPNLSNSDRLALIGELSAALAPPAERAVDKIAGQMSGEASAWGQGYDLAESVLRTLGIDLTVPGAVEIDEILSVLGVRLKEMHLSDRAIRAVSIAGPDFQPTILVNVAHPTASYPTGRRFSLAHELCHLIVDRSYAREVAIPSGPWAPRDIERRANAFAAMFLMPPGRIAAVLKTIGGEPADPSSVRRLCQALETSFTATVEHMHNLGFIDDVERDSLREQAIDG